MCGGGLRSSQGGALAVLSLSHDTSGSPIRSRVPIMAGRLLFHIENQKNSASAGSVSLVPDQNLDPLVFDDDCTIGIHETGDLTTSAIISPFKYRFGLQRSLNHDTEESANMRAALPSPLMLRVGGEGIIGRRVTIWNRNAVAPLAEGIIGYN